MDTIPVCRICMKTSLEYIHFETPFEQCGADNDNENHEDEHSKPFTYFDCFRICTHLEVTKDFGPQSLCHSCGLDLKITYDFLQNANKAHQIFLEARLQTKLEIVESEEMEFEEVQQYLQEDSISVKNYVSDEDPVETNAVQEISNYIRSDNEELLVKQEELQSSEDENEYITTDSSLRVKSLASLHKEKEKISQLMANIYKNTGPFQQVVENKDADNEKDFVVKLLPTEPPPIRNNRQRLTKKKVIKSIDSEKQEDEEEKELDMNVSGELKKQKFMCHTCPSFFRHARNLRRHEQTHQQQRERNFTCEHCGRKFFQKYGLNEHLKTHEHNREPAYKCDECNKSFYHRGSLTVHQQSHSGKGFDCAVCGKRFLRQIDLDVHSRGHSGDLPYKCSKCDRAFARVGHLNAHLLRHDGYRYKCDICGKDYLCPSTLAQHRKEHTGMPLKCSICDKEFPRLFKMRRHIQGVHKIKSAEEAELLIIKMETKKEYRTRMFAVERFA